MDSDRQGAADDSLEDDAARIVLRYAGSQFQWQRVLVQPLGANISGDTPCGNTSKAFVALVPMYPIVTWTYEVLGSNLTQLTASESIRIRFECKLLSLQDYECRLDDTSNGGHTSKITF